MDVDNIDLMRAWQTVDFTCLHQNLVVHIKSAVANCRVDILHANFASFIRPLLYRKQGAVVHGLLAIVGCRVYSLQASLHQTLTVHIASNWLSLQYRRDFHKFVMVYKCRNGLAPQYLCDIFNSNHDIHNLNTRNASLRVTKHAKARTAYYHGSYALSGQRLWNDLPNNIKLCTSLSSFKNALYKYLIAKPQF